MRVPSLRGRLAWVTGAAALTLTATLVPPAVAAGTADPSLSFDAHGCPQGAVCVWQGTNFSGTRHDYYTCDNHAMNFYGPISYVNNQYNTSGDEHADFKTQYGWNITTADPPSSNASVGTNSYFYYIDPCD